MPFKKKIIDNAKNLIKIERFNSKNYEKLVDFYECFTTCNNNKEINIKIKRNKKIKKYNPTAAR
jgi:hypothetical protein